MIVRSSEKASLVLASFSSSEAPAKNPLLIKATRISLAISFSSLKFIITPPFYKHYSKGRRKGGVNVVDDAKKEKAVKDIATILDGFTANEINEVLFEVQTFCNANYVFDLKNAKGPANFHPCELPGTF